MYKENEIVEALKLEPNPYYQDAHRRIAAQMGVRTFDVSMAAKNNSLILDRAIEERKAKHPEISQPLPETARTDERNELMEQFARMRIANEPTRLEISDFQYRREVDGLKACLKTLEQVTPELLARVGLGK